MFSHDVVEERQRIWLSWLDLPWDIVRKELADEMARVGMSQEDLAFEMRQVGYGRVSYSTLGDWIKGRSKKPPPLDASIALVRVFARVSLGEWTKGAYVGDDEAEDALLVDRLTAIASDSGPDHVIHVGHGERAVGESQAFSLSGFAQA